VASSEDSYAYLRELVLKLTANYIDPSRNALFETRLTPLARIAGAADLDAFVQHLRSAGDPLRSAVGEAMMIHETSFFRDLMPFDLLRRKLLPELIERRRGEKKLRVWSAASSTGQEAYSLAMLLCESFPELEDWSVKIIGTDISSHVSDYAARGRFRRIEVNRGLPARMLVKYFKRDGEEWQIDPRVRKMVEFRVANLCAPLPALPVFDLVLLRNVLLYFPQQDRGCVLTDVYQRLRPDGALVLGNAEQAEDSTDLFQATVEAGCYYYRPVAGPRTWGALAA
jgi:chemotaxis protein methyltransferase CheR